MNLISSLFINYGGLLTTLGDLAEDFKTGSFPGYEFLGPILGLIDSALIPIIIILLALGTIYAVVLGVNMARADSTEKREEAKKRLINVIAGVGIIVVLLAIIYALAANVDTILGLAESTLE